MNNTQLKCLAKAQTPGVCCLEAVAAEYCISLMTLVQFSVPHQVTWQVVGFPQSQHGLHRDQVSDLAMNLGSWKSRKRHRLLMAPSQLILWSRPCPLCLLRHLPCAHIAAT